MVSWWILLVSATPLGVGDLMLSCRWKLFNLPVEPEEVVFCTLVMTVHLDTTMASSNWVIGQPRFRSYRRSHPCFQDFNRPENVFQALDTWSVATQTFPPAYM